MTAVRTQCICARKPRIAQIDEGEMPAGDGGKPTYRFRVCWRKRVSVGRIIAGEMIGYLRVKIGQKSGDTVYFFWGIVLFMNYKRGDLEMDFFCGPS